MTYNLEKIVAWAKRRWFVYPWSDIYGGLSNAWDFWPYGVELKRNISNMWWDFFVQKRDDIMWIDAQILMNRKVWKASGHEEGFHDPLMDCKKCKNRFRADKLIEEYIQKSNDKDLPNNWAGEGTPVDDLKEYIYSKKIICPHCRALDYTDIRQFKLMFKTSQWVVEDDSSLVYLRPETAQWIFVNYKNILDTTRVRVPFGLAQIWKAFRNEITPWTFIYRLREFEQMEIEYFVEPSEAKKLYEEWKELCFYWRHELLWIKKDDIRARLLDDKEAAHYADCTYDFEYKFPWWWGEIQAFNNRTDYDLKKHQEHSGQNMQYTDPKTWKRFIPYVIEASFWLTRTTFVSLVNAYCEEEYVSKNWKTENRVVAKFNKELAPVKYAVLPLVEKSEEMVNLARKIYDDLKQNYSCEIDLKWWIWKRYRRQDEIGTPTCVTIDHQTLEDNTVTLRDRDTMAQTRVNISDIN